MSVVAVPDRPGWHRLTDADGIPLARFERVEREGRVVADWFELEVPIERAVPVILAELRGMRIAGPEAPGRALIAHGARPARHAHVYRHHLEARPEPDPAWDLRPLENDAAALVAPYRAAHPPDHVDHAVVAGEDSLVFLTSVLNGAFGPLLDCSGVAYRDDRVVGAILITQLDGEPWIIEVFRDPDARGAGGALLRRALALCEGPTLGLAVTHGNPAERVYQALGFAREFTAFSVDL